MRTSDPLFEGIIEKFAWLVGQLSTEHSKLLSEAAIWLAAPNHDAEQGVAISEQLYDILEKLAPNGCYLGSNDELGADPAFLPIDMSWSMDWSDKIN